MSKPFIFSTGYSVNVQQISHRLANEVYKSRPRPKPPTQMIEVAGEMRETENTAHPDYQAALAAHYIEIELLMRKLVLKRGVVLDLDETQKAAVSQLRQDMSELGVSTLPDDDRECWLYHIAIGTPQDEVDLMAVIRGESQPTEEHVQAAIATFQGDVSG